MLKISRDEDIGAGVPHWEAGVRSKVGPGVVGKGGEHSVKQFMNVKVKSSKEEVKVHAKNELVSESKLDKKKKICEIFVVGIIALVHVETEAIVCIMFSEVLP